MKPSQLQHQRDERWLVREGSKKEHVCVVPV